MEYKWTISKSFSWEMGHRVWSQKLDHPELSIETHLACRHLHGHSYELKVFLSANSLDQSAMVTDFKNLNFMKKFIDDNLDHKFMIDINDPNIEIITGLSFNVIKARISQDENFLNLGKIWPAGSIDSDDLTNFEFIQLHRDSFVLVNFVPTSENICRYLKTYAQERIGSIAIVTATELWETKKSHCRYAD